MINAQQAINRLKKSKEHKDLREEDYRAAVYVQTFTPGVDGEITGFQPRQFPNGAIILMIAASASVDPGEGGGADAQAGNNRNLFKIDFSYTGGEALVIDGPVLADALMGGGDLSHFPAKELVIKENQNLNCRVQNMAAQEMTVDVAYHCLVYRYAS